MTNADAIRALFEEIIEHDRRSTEAWGEWAREAGRSGGTLWRELDENPKEWRARLDALLASPWHKWPEEKPTKVSTGPDAEYLVLTADGCYELVEWLGDAWGMYGEPYRLQDL